MAEYPNNSYNAREKKPEGSGPPDKKLEKVVSGGTKTRKKSEVKKFANIFVPEDVENVKSYILIDVIVPGIKNAIADAVSIMLLAKRAAWAEGTTKAPGLPIRDTTTTGAMTAETTDGREPLLVSSMTILSSRPVEMPIWCWTSWNRRLTPMASHLWPICMTLPASPVAVTRRISTAGLIFGLPK